MSGNLSNEQRRKIEENRRKALEKRAARLNQPKQPDTCTLRLTENYVKTNKSTGPFSMQSVARQSNTKEHSATGSGNVGFGGTRPFPGQGLNSSNKSQIQTTETTSNNNGHETMAEKTTNIQEFVSKFARPSSSKTSFTKNDKSFGVDTFFSTNSKTTLESKPQQNSQLSTNNKDKVCGASVAPALGTTKDTKITKGTCILISKKRFAVKVGYNAQLIGVFRTIPSHSYDQTTTTWNFALEDYKTFLTNAKTLQPSVYIERLPKTILSVFTKTTPGTLKELSSQDINLNSVDSKLVSSLMSFQKQGVSFCIRHDGRALVADDMGLGKTVQAICVASYYRKEWPLLVITPSSVRITWQQAIIRWLPSVDPQYINVVLTGKDKPTSGLVNIISYDLLSKYTEQLKTKPPRVVIADESHFIKNYKAARTKVALPLMKAATRVILLSGTPALSRPIELYTQICAVRPTLFPSFHEFGLRYCGAVPNRWGWDYSGSSNMEELQLILEESIMIRRMKKEVLTELPSKRRQVVLLDPSLIKKKPLERAAKQVANAKQKDQHGALLNYFFESCASKMSAVKEYVLDLLEGGHKFLVFAHHKDMLDAVTTCLIAKKYKYIRIDGETPSSKRQMLCDKFQKEKDVVVAVLSITAANTGLTLTEGTAVVFAELFWNPGALAQAEDRVYRIGQKNSVNIHYLVAKGTADDFLWPLIQGKLEVLNKAGLSGDDFSNADMTTFKDPKQKTLLSCFESLMEENEEIDAALSNALDQETMKSASTPTAPSTSRTTLPMATDSMATDPIATKPSSDTKESVETSDRCRLSDKISSSLPEDSLKSKPNDDDLYQDDDDDMGFNWFTSLDDGDCLLDSESVGNRFGGKSKKPSVSTGGDNGVEPCPKRSKR